MLPTNPDWLNMTTAQVLEEYLQIRAYRYEEKNPGKLFSDKTSEATVDENFDEYLRSLEK